MIILLTLFAGLGLFFIGIRLMSSHLKQMAGHRMRLMVRRAVGDRRAATALGLLAGAVMQNVNGVIFLLSSLVSAGAMDLRKTLPIINGANVGTSMIVVLAAFSLHLGVLFLVGLTGLMYYLNLDQTPRYRHLIGATLGICLLFLGLDVIKDGAALLKNAEWMQEAVTFWGHSLLLSALVGVAVTLLAQSSSTITVVAITLASVGLIQVHTGIAIILGAGLASGISAWFLGRTLTGSTRQLVLYQLLLKTFGVAATSLLLILESFSGLPLLMAGFDALGFSPEITLATVYVLVQVMCDLVMHPLHHRIEALLERIHPPHPVEVLGQPRYLKDQGLDEAESALMLVELESRRLLADLPAFLDALRETPGQTAAVGIGVLHDAGRKVSGECAEFLTRIADLHHSRDVLERTLILRQRNELVAALQDSLLDFHAAIMGAGRDNALLPLLHSLVESLHMLLSTLAETGESPTPADIEWLSRLTYDRSELMDGLRRRCLGLGGQTERQTQESLFAATSIFERAVWLLHRYVLLLDPETRLRSMSPRRTPSA